MKLIVTGCGRTGTQYLAKLLQAAGVKAGHERVYNAGEFPDRAAFQVNDVEVSWWAAPWLDPLSESCTIWHLVRHPLKSLRCWVKHRLLKDNCNSGRFVHGILPETVTGTDLERAVAYLVQWNLMVEERARERFRVEDLNPNDLWIALHEADVDDGVSSDDVERAFSEVPMNVGSCAHANEPDITWDQVLKTSYGSQLKEMAVRYGYLD